jgi:hypothetical protein
MKFAALTTWLLTAGGGFILLSIWLARGGMHQQRGAGNRLGRPLIISHFLLAAGGLVLWIIYLAADEDAVDWIAPVALAVVALPGFTMFAIWLRRRQGRGGAADAVTPKTRPEQHSLGIDRRLPGVLAATTLVFVLFTAIGVGGS